MSVLREELTLANFTKLGDQEAAKQFQLNLTKAVEDLLDRPHLKTKREVHLILKIAPFDTQDPECERVIVEFHHLVKLPRHETRAFSMEAHRNKKLSFHPDFPDEPGRPGLFDGQSPDDQKKESK